MTYSSLKPYSDHLLTMCYDHMNIAEISEQLLEMAVGCTSSAE